MPWLFFSIFILVGGGMIFNAARKIHEGCQAVHWPHTIGTLLESKSQDTSNSESSSRSIVVRYVYIVDDREYEGATIHPTYGSSGDEKVHQGLQQVLTPGKKLRVYYRRDMPKQSTLVVGFYSGSLATLFGGVLLATVGLGLLLLYWFTHSGNWDYASGVTVIE